jgi:ribonuclease P/MRP protein subunit POP1
LSGEKSPSTAIVGYVTTGGISLSLGRGQAIGAITLVSYIEMREQLRRQVLPFFDFLCVPYVLSRLRKVGSLPLVKIRNRDSLICRAAYVEIMG